MTTRPTRRGADAIEFALVAPILLMMLIGIMEYGWYFFEEAQVTAALREAVRQGAIAVPAEADAPGRCTPCLAAASTAAVAELDRIGITVGASTVTPAIQSVQGSCALVLDAEIPHGGLVGFVPVPDHYPVRVLFYASNVKGC